MVERQFFGTPQPCGFPDAGHFAAAVRAAKSDCNPWRNRNRDCHPPKPRPLAGIPGRDFDPSQKKPESRQHAGRLLQKSHPPASKNRTVSAPVRLTSAPGAVFCAQVASEPKAPKKSRGLGRDPPQRPKVLQFSALAEKLRVGLCFRSLTGFADFAEGIAKQLQPDQAGRQAVNHPAEICLL